MTEKPKSTPENLRESLEKSLPEIIKILEKSYNNQWNHTYSLDEAFNITRGRCNEISGVLMKNGIANVMGQKELISFFTKQWYSFAISPMNIWGDRYVVNHPLYRLWKSELYDMSSIRFDTKYKLPIQKIWVTAYLVNETLIPDIRKARTWFDLDGLTVSDPITNVSSILLFPERIKRTAEYNKQDPLEYKKVVAMNEFSQAYFLKIIPTRFLPIELNSIGIQVPRGITIHHLLEAFSDLCSLKFSKWWKHEVLRILWAKDNWYELSHMLISADIQKYFPMMTPEWISKKIENMNSTEYNKLNQYIIEGLEQNILPVIIRAKSKLSQMN